ncbi:hypothetical protein PR048_029704 [Dryococelus australis]|uniref:Vesicle-fusing ATPase n=1 Tax=Dryococelus australis TaxID=614101 RepID=A0ABQ9GE46_9NEOP|nr:hypothetical protein PR048_029704 [Dryococelus australis]
MYLQCKHVEVTTGPSHHFVFSIKFHSDVPRGTVAFSLMQRKWATLSINQDIEVKPYHFDPTSSSECLCNMVLDVDFLQKKTTALDPYDTDFMAKEFLFQFSGQAFTVGQLLVFSFSKDKKTLGLVVKSLEDQGAAVPEWLDCSPPTLVNWVQSPTGSLLDFCKWGLCRMMPLVGRFCQGSPISPAIALLHSHLISP